MSIFSAALLLSVAQASAAPAPSAAPASSVEETEVAQRLAAEATEFLDGLLGPGRAKVVVSVSAERSQTITQSEVLTPIPKQPASIPADQKPLPGYAPKNAERPIDYVQRDQEQTVRTSGLIIKGIRASVVLDANVPEAQVNAVRRVLPDLLHMEADRGDNLTVLRAEMEAPWKLTVRGQFMNLLFIGVAVVLIILVCLLGYLTATRVVRIFVTEMAAARRAAGPHLPAGGFPGQGFGGALPPGGQGLPELGPGGMPGLEGELQSGLGPALPAPGKRFDFIAGKDPKEVAALLGEEPPEDLALLFAYLTESNPEMAVHVFSSFTPNQQAAVAQALVHLKMADPEKLAMLESRLKTQMEFGIRGAERLSRLLNRLTAEEREGILMGISAQSPDEAQEVEKFLFTFEELGSLKPGDLRRLLVAVPYQSWGQALRGAPQAMVDRVLTELPAGTRQIVREAMESPQPRDKVMEARAKILASAQSLAGKGQITLGREGASAEMI